MSPTEIEAFLLDRYGVKVGPAMRSYVADQLAKGEAAPFPILAGDARTGRAVRRLIVPGEAGTADAAVH